MFEFSFVTKAKSSASSTTADLHRLVCRLETSHRDSTNTRRNLKKNSKEMQRTTGFVTEFRITAAVVQSVRPPVLEGPNVVAWFRLDDDPKEKFDRREFHHRRRRRTAERSSRYSAGRSCRWESAWCKLPRSSLHCQTNTHYTNSISTVTFSLSCQPMFIHRRTKRKS